MTGELVFACFLWWMTMPFRWTAHELFTHD
jgi:hypothetical protein